MLSFVFYLMGGKSSSSHFIVLLLTYQCGHLSIYLYLYLAFNEHSCEVQTIINVPDDNSSRIFPTIKTVPETRNYWRKRKDLKIQIKILLHTVILYEVCFCRYTCYLCILVFNSLADPLPLNHILIFAIRWHFP